MRFDLFSELLQTASEYDDGVAMSHTVNIPALGHLARMADSETINRCLQQLAAQRASIMKEEDK